MPPVKPPSPRSQSNIAQDKWETDYGQLKLRERKMEEDQKSVGSSVDDAWEAPDDPESDPVEMKAAYSSGRGAFD